MSSQTIDSRTAWQIQKAVVHALYLREMKTRFGSKKWGYFWALVEPSAYIALFWIMFGMHLRRSMPGVDYPMFLMTGMVPWYLFSGSVTRSMSAFESNRGLLNYRQVKPIDTLYARLQVELLVHLAVFMTFLLLGAMLGFQTRIHHMIGWLLLTVEFTIFCFGCGLLCAVLGSFSETFQKVIGLIMRPLFFASGLFFAAASVPEIYRDILLLNPVLNFLEFFRFYFFESYPLAGADHGYILGWTIALTFTAFWLYVALEKRIKASS